MSFDCDIWIVYSGDVEIIEVIGQTRNVFASAVNNGDDSDDEPLVKVTKSNKQGLIWNLIADISMRW